jgi:hypothetical protein
MSSLFQDKADLRAILIVALLPMFLKSLTDGNQEEEDTVPQYDGRSSNERACPVSRQIERLERILLRAAATFDASDLEDYLAHPTTCCITDLAAAFRRLPVRLMIAQVNEVMCENPVVFTNICELRDEDGRQFNLDSCFLTVLGQDLHVLYGNTCSPGGAQQIKRAVMKGKTFKKVYNLPQAECKLLSMLPIKDQDGQAALTVSLETEAFSVQNGEVDSEEPFLQIEDLMALLPVLIPQPTSRRMAHIRA